MNSRFCPSKQIFKDKQLKTKKKPMKIGFEAKISEGFNFKKIIDSLREIVDTANIYLTKN